MSHPDYAHIGDPITKVQEECAELIKALCKAQRFGWDNTNPTTGARNIDRVREEIADVRQALDELEKTI